MDLKNKIAIVTGSRRGIGKGIVEAFAKQGCNVVVSDINLEDCKKLCSNIENKYKVRTLAVKCDVSNKKEVDSMIKATIDKFKKIDILVNNAGIFPFKPFMKMEEADWENVLDINLKGVYICSQAAVEYMKKGNIINISSVASIKGFPALAHYCASKAGINGLTRTMALELAPKIRVNSIAPGLIETPGVQQGLDEKAKKQMIENIPLARAGRPEDIANLALFLASEESSYITGQVIIIDGGWTVK